MEMEEMLALSPEAVLKTVYIKQREVDILALQEPKELRELITTLFGLDEFNRVKEDIFKTELLSEIKKNSVKYIEEKNTCPVCNKPLEEREKMISVINEEIKRIDEGFDPLNTNLDETEVKIKKAREGIESSNSIEAALDSLTPSTDLLLENRRQIAELLDELGAKDYNSFISGLEVDSIDEITERKQDLETDINSYRGHIEEERKRMKTEEEQYKKDIQILSKYEHKKISSKKN